MRVWDAIGDDKIALELKSLNWDNFTLLIEGKLTPPIII